MLEEGQEVGEKKTGKMSEDKKRMKGNDLKMINEPKIHCLKSQFHIRPQI